MGWLSDILAKRRLEKAKAHLVRRANQFNRTHAEVADFSHWMCPACGQILKGKEVRTRASTEMVFPPCCEQFNWAGGRNFHSNSRP